MEAGAEQEKVIDIREPERPTQDTAAAGRRRLLRLAACCLCVWLALPLQAREPPLVKAVLDAIPVAAATRCAYTRVSIEGDEVEAERYDHRSPGSPWRLLRVGDEAPGPEQLRRYESKREDRADRQHPLSLQIRDMVDPTSWRPVADDGLLAEFEFRLRPHGELTDRLAQHVVGSFVIDKPGRQPVRLRVESTEPATVAPLVRLTHYAEDLRFRMDAAVGAPALVERRTERRGRALGVRSLNRMKTYRYQDYACDGRAPGRGRGVTPSVGSAAQGGGR